jgi:hypothetical protein
MQVKWWITIKEPKILAMGYSVPIGYAANFLNPWTRTVPGRSYGPLITRQGEKTVRAGI